MGPTEPSGRVDGGCQMRKKEAGGAQPLLGVRLSEWVDGGAEQGTDLG